MPVLLPERIRIESEAGDDKSDIKENGFTVEITAGDKGKAKDWRLYCRRKKTMRVFSERDFRRNFGLKFFPDRNL